MGEKSFDLYDREKTLLAEGPELLKTGSDKDRQEFAQRLYDAFARIVRENEDLTRHSDRQERRLVRLNKNLKTQTQELDERKNALEDLSQQLAKYLPPQIHEAIFTGNHHTQVTTERKKLTVFFSDIKDFTKTSENVQPEALTEYLNEYFSVMTDIALDQGATIDKYMGDAMMVFFGDPETRGTREDARACVEMALRMQEKMRILQTQWRRKGFENPFEIRIGINTGYCNVGNFGSDQRLSYTIIGAEVNIAQRIEVNADIGGILMSYETYMHARDMIEVEERDAIRMKGIDRDVKTFSVIGRKSEKENKNLMVQHPAGVSIDLDPNAISGTERVKLAEQLIELVNKIKQ